MTIVTEAAARKLECRCGVGAALQQQAPQLHGLNIPQQPQVGFIFPLCSGTKCMFWRWADPSVNGDRRGYCGLAGVPLVDRED